ALLRDARSLTEREVERASIRHGLGWFLTKAHMADLLARLRQGGPSPVHLRSAGPLNVYEWREGTGTGRRDSLDQEAARDVVDALRGGVVPERHLELLAVGQEDVRGHLMGLLGHVENGRAEFKFVRGAYGAGKTFLCSWLKDQALASEFAASTVRIGPDQPLSELPVFFSGLIDGLRTPEKREASALADILESWLLTIHRRTARLEGVDAQSPQARKRLAQLVEGRVAEELAKLSDVDPGFGPALGAFYRARLNGDHELASAALSWIRGSRSIPSAILRRLGVRGHLTSDQVFPRMRALLQVIEGGRLRGLLLVLDELELVRRFPHARQRERAYETLRLLIDESGENALPGCLLICTGTDQLFEDDRFGLPSYRALAHRVAPPQGTATHASLRQPIIPLKSLDRDGLLAVASRIRDIHAIAYDWPAAERIATDLLERLVDQWTAFGDMRVGRLPRPVLREVVNLLDLCEEHPEVPPEQYLKTPTGEGALAESVLAVLDD
ncbi:MAG: BREX system ATP-binding domain-containing protein, partial [bacterium]